MIKRDAQVPQGKIDLTNCEREPIHIPGSVQPHGVLFVLKEPELTVLQVSNNSDAVIGIAAQTLLDQPLDTFIDSSQLAPLKAAVTAQEMFLINPLKLQLQVREQAQTFDGIVHRTASGLILELEAADITEHSTFQYFHHVVQGVVAQLQTATSLAQLLQMAAEHVRRITGFDRVMIYRFGEDWHGEVVAEDKLEALNPFLGLHYPASDIPSQARDLYVLNKIRLIADVNYTPAAILPSRNPVTGGALDLSFAVLRSVSPIHIEYLQNMGVGASMSISLMKGNRLWGLIACHHQSANYVSIAIRTACELIGQIVSLQLEAKEELEDYSYIANIKHIEAVLVEHLSKEEQFIVGLFKHSADLLKMVNARGAVIVFDDHYIPIGEVPKERDVRSLIAWLQQQMQQYLFSTDYLAKYYPEAENMKDRASGLLAISLSKTQKNYILCFRPEVIHTVQWGGDPAKPVEVGTEGMRLHPRLSFEAWKQAVRLTALPWKKCELEVAWEFRTAVMDLLVRYMVVQRAEVLAQLNTVLRQTNAELEQKNEEIQAFAFALAHDLRTPLSAISGYAELMEMDPQTELSPHIKHCIQSILKASSQMDQFIGDLLKYTRLGRDGLNLQLVSLHELLVQIGKSYEGRLRETEGHIQIAAGMPMLKSDPTLLSQIFINLFDNALTYRRPDVAPEITVRYQIEGQHVVIAVSDNGIGIEPKNFEKIFIIFQRLHSPNKYPGTGIGLAVVKKSIELLDGQIALESVPGRGTTFKLRFPLIH